MAGVTIFVTYHKTTKVVVGMHLNQADANTEAAGDANLLALNGGQDQAQDALGNMVDAMLCQPDGIWSVYPAAPFLRHKFIDPYPLRTAYRTWHERLEELSDLLIQVGPNYPQVDVNLGHDTLFALHQGAYFQYHHSGLSTTNQFLWLRSSALGPNDAVGGVQIYSRENPRTIFRIMAELDPRPTIPLGVLSVCNPEPPFARRTLAEMYRDNLAEGEAAHVPTVAQLDEGDWLERIAA